MESQDTNQTENERMNRLHDMDRKVSELERQHQQADQWRLLPPAGGLALPGVQSGGPLPELFAAKAKARAKFEPIERTREVTVRPKDPSKPSYTFLYAPLDVVLAATMPALAENGLDLFWLLAESPDGGANLTCMLTHASGAYIATTMRLPPAEGPQARGSQITYGRRYQAQAVLGVASEEDDDGNMAAGNSASVQARQRHQDGAGKSAAPTPRREPQSPSRGRSGAASGNGGAPPQSVARGGLRAGSAPDMDTPPPPDDSQAPPDHKAVANARAQAEDRPLPFPEPEQEAPSAEPTLDMDADVDDMQDTDLFAEVKKHAETLGVTKDDPAKAKALVKEITGKGSAKELDHEDLRKFVKGLRGKVRALAAQSAGQS